MTANNSDNGGGINLPDSKSTTGKTSRVKCSESRKIRKPLMEKRRRARINHSLNELKRMLLEANGTPARKEGSRPAKLEKADILELTVRHLQTLQNSKVPVTKASPQPLISDSDEDSSCSSTLPSNCKPEKRTATIHPSTKSTITPINYQELSPVPKNDQSEEPKERKSNYMDGFTECIRMMTTSLETFKADKTHHDLEDHVKMQLTEANQTCYNKSSNNNSCDNHPGSDVHANLYLSEHRFGDKMDLRFENQDKRYTLHPTRISNGDWAFILKCSADPNDNHGIKIEPELMTEMHLANSPSMHENQRHPQPNHLFLQHQFSKDNQRFLWRPW